MPAADRPGPSHGEPSTPAVVGNPPPMPAPGGPPALAPPDATPSRRGRRTATDRPIVPYALEFAASITWRVLLVGVGIVALVFALAQLRLIVLPVLVAILASTALVPPARWLRRHRVPAVLATLVVVLGSLALLGGVVWGMSVQVGDQFDDLGQQVSEGIDEVESWLATGPLDLEREEIDRYIERARAQFSEQSSTLASGALSGAVLVAEVVAGILLTIVLLFFFVKDGEEMSRWFLELVPDHRHDLVRNIARRSWATLGGYLRGVAIIGAVDAAVIGIGLVVLGVPLVVPLMALTFLGAFFPLIGATMAGVVAVLVALVSEGFITALLVAAVVIAVQEIEGDLLQPLVMGRALALHPVVILIALTAGGVLGGLVGAFLAVPVTAVLVGIGTELRRQAGEPVGEPVEQVEEGIVGR